MSGCEIYPTSQPGAMDNSWRTPVATMEFSIWVLVEHLNSLWRNIWSLGDQRIGRDGTWRKECDRFTILSLMTFTFAIWLPSDETQQRNLGAKSMKTRAKAFHGLRDGFFHHRELTWFTIWVVPFTPSGWFIMENPSINRWFGGTSILGNLHMYPFVI